MSVRWMDESKRNGWHGSGRRSAKADSAGSSRSGIAIHEKLALSIPDRPRKNRRACIGGCFKLGSP